MPENRKLSVQKSEMSGLPVDLAAKDTYLALVAEARDWKEGSGITLTLVLFNEDGTKVQHQNGAEEVRLKPIPMPLNGPRFTCYAMAIFPEVNSLGEDTPGRRDNRCSTQHALYVHTFEWPHVLRRNERSQRPSVELRATLRINCPHVFNASVVCDEIGAAFAGNDEPFIECLRDSYSRGDAFARDEPTDEK